MLWTHHHRACRYTGPVTPQLRASLSIVRYQSSVISVTYQDFCDAAQVGHKQDGAYAYT